MRAAAAGAATSTAMPADQDVARIGRPAPSWRTHVLRNGQQLELVVLPIYGSGY